MLWLLALALVLVVWLVRRGRRAAPVLRAAGWILAAGLLALGVALAPPLVVLRKIVGLAVMPATLVWVALATLVVRAWSQLPRWRWALAGVLAAYSIAGSPALAFVLLRSLERPFDRVRPLADDARYDAVLIMGGGSWMRPGGGTQLGPSGDRLRLAAALQARDRAAVLVTSGSAAAGERDFSAETATLLRGMGVPASVIVRVPDARNSRQEIEAYTRLVREHGWRRVGLLTSARHLRRALALCERNGLAVAPLPSDFRAEPPTWDPLVVIPRGQSFASVEEAVWEYVGLAAVYLVGG